MTSSFRAFDLPGEIPPRAWQEDIVFLSLWVWLVGINSSVYPDEPLSCGLWMLGVWEAGRAGSHGVLRPAGAWRGVDLAGRMLRNSDGATGEGREKLAGGGWGAPVWTRCWGRLSGRDLKAMRGQGWLPQGRVVG